MKIHHTTKSDKKCSQCNRKLIWRWEDAEEKNGQLETTFGKDKICENCVAENNGGRPPLGLRDLNEIRRREITKDKYYKEMGY